MFPYDDAVAANERDTSAVAASVCALYSARGITIDESTVSDGYVRPPSRTKLTVSSTDSSDQPSFQSVQ